MRYAVPTERDPKGATLSDRRRFCVIVHDVTPVFHRELEFILDQVLPEVGGTLAGAVVPCWHGRSPQTGERRLLRRWTDLFSEILLHGCTHRREQRPGLVSWLTNRADELGGLGVRAAAERIQNGRSLLSELSGRPILGFVAPAWQLPGGVSTLRLSGLEYSVGFRRLISTSARPLSLATWSWDWGRLALASRIGAALGSWVRLFDQSAVPVIVLHPADVDRGFVPAAVRLIRRLKADGRQPIGIEALASGSPQERASR